MSTSSREHDGALRLVMSRGRSARFLILCLVFVAMGVALLWNQPWVAWAAIAFFGLGTVLFVAQVVHPPMLLLDDDGFEQRLLFRRRSPKMMWEDCGPFVAEAVGSTQLVVYDTTATNKRELRALNRALAGGDEAVQVGFGGLKANELAQLMNRYRDAKLAIQRAPEK